MQKNLYAGTSGGLRYALHKVPPGIAHLIHSVWSVEAAPDSSAALSYQILLPHACSDLTLFYDTPFECYLPNGIRSSCPRTVLFGSQDGPHVIGFGKQTQMISLRFRPGGLPTVFGIPDACVAGDVIDFELVDSRTRNLIDHVLTAPTFSDAVNRLLGFLRMFRHHAMPGALDHFVKQILDSRGTLSVLDISNRVGWTARRMQRTFRDLMGLTPKQFSRIVRVRNTLELMDTSAMSIADIAMEAGYFDQSHLVRDFRDLTGFTPERIAASSPHLALYRLMTCFDVEMPVQPGKELRRVVGK